MPSTRVKINKGASREIQEELARRMMAATLFFVEQHQQRLNVSNPFPHLTPSKPGEYPRKRTGFLQKSVAYLPLSIPEVMRTWVIKLGYDANAFYGPRLEVMMKRLGLVRTLREILPQMAKIIGQKVSMR